MRRAPKKRTAVREEMHMVLEQNRPTYHTKSGDNSAYDKSCPFCIELQADAKTENQA
jgi:hypothetical protein